MQVRRRSRIAGTRFSCTVVGPWRSFVSHSSHHVSLVFLTVAVNSWLCTSRQFAIINVDRVPMNLSPEIPRYWKILGRFCAITTKLDRLAALSPCTQYVASKVGFRSRWLYVVSVGSQHPAMFTYSIRHSTRESYSWVDTPTFPTEWIFLVRRAWRVWHEVLTRSTVDRLVPSPSWNWFAETLHTAEHVGHEGTGNAVPLVMSLVRRTQRARSFPTL